MFAYLNTQVFVCDKVLFVCPNLVDLVKTKILLNLV